MRNLTPNPFPRGKGKNRAHDGAASSSAREMRNLTPGPFPRGKGSKTWRTPLPLQIIRFPFPRAKGFRTIRFPFPRGKGLGVRFFVFHLNSRLHDSRARL